MSFVSSFSDGIRLTVKVKPGISHTRLWKIVDVGDGKQALEIAVAAQPEGGKANKELCAQLAKIFKIPRADVVVKAGQTGRLKVVEIIGVTLEMVEKAVVDL